MNKCDVNKKVPRYCRNRIETPILLSAILGVAAIAIFLIIAIMMFNDKEMREETDHEYETNINLYFEDGMEMLGGELTNIMETLTARSGTAISFAVKTLASDGNTYYNRDANGQPAPAYTEPSTTDPKYIRSFGVFEIHIYTGADGRKTVSATQIK